MRERANRNACGASPALGTNYALNLKAQDVRGERCHSTHASTPSTSDAVLSPEIEYVRRLNRGTRRRREIATIYIAVNFKDV